MDVRIGVLNHSIISHKVKNKDSDEPILGIEEMEELEENWNYLFIYYQTNYQYFILIFSFI